MNERCLHNTKLRSTLPRVASLLVLIIVVHQYVMATPAHEAIMPMMGHDMQAVVPIQDSPNCPCCPVQTTAICPAVQAALPFGMAAVCCFVALIAVSALSVSVPTGPGIIAFADWRPPPKHTLVLFQTFRC